MSLWLWIKAVTRHLWALMSCAIFTAIGFYAAFASKNNEWIVRSTFLAAVVCLFMACFLAWKDEHTKLLEATAEKEQLKQRYFDERPKLGMVINGPRGEGEWTRRAHTGNVYFEMQHLSGRIPTSIRFDPIPSKLGRFLLQFEALSYLTQSVRPTLDYDILEVGAAPLSAADLETTRPYVGEMLMVFLGDTPDAASEAEYVLTARFRDNEEERSQSFRLLFNRDGYYFERNTADV